ncbi:MAG: translation elongation factor-like protein [Candidatus Woesearchaeota archaeon]
MEKPVGKITHYYTKIGVAVVELTDALKVGDRIHIKGAHTDFEQDVVSMQIEHKNVSEAKAKASIGLKVKDHVRNGDVVFKIEE